MKTFEEWLYKTNYEFTIRRNNQHSAYHIKGSNDRCIVHLTKGARGGYVMDSSCNDTKCKSIKDVIGLVNFLCGGIIEL